MVEPPWWELGWVVALLGLHWLGPDLPPAGSLTLFETRSEERQVPGHGEGQLLVEGRPAEVTPAQAPLPSLLDMGAEHVETPEEAGLCPWGPAAPSGLWQAEWSQLWIGKARKNNLSHASWWPLTQYCAGLSLSYSILNPKWFVFCIWNDILSSSGSFSFLLLHLGIIIFLSLCELRGDASPWWCYLPNGLSSYLDLPPLILCFACCEIISWPFHSMQFFMYFLNYQA